MGDFKSNPMGGQQGRLFLELTVSTLPCAGSPRPALTLPTFVHLLPESFQVLLAKVNLLCPRGGDHVRPYGQIKDVATYHDMP